MPKPINEPPPQPLVAASILSADFARMGEECADVLQRGVDLLHLDVMDGHFVPNLTMGPAMCHALRQRFPDTFLDVHLMTERPGDWIEPFADAGASLVTFHVENCRPMKQDGEDADRLIERIHQRAMAAGMALNPDTEASRLDAWVDTLDLVLVMSVHPGYAGQKFIPGTLDHAKRLKQAIGQTTRLAIDGGVKPYNGPDIAEAGVDVMVVASGLFHADDRAAAIEQFHNAGRRSERR